MLGLLLTLALGGPARAADPVISAPGQEVQAGRLVRAVGLGEAEPLGLDEALSPLPRVVVLGAEAHPCTAAVGDTPLVETLDAAQAELDMLEYEGARARLGALEQALPCTGRPVPPAPAARLFFLDGYAAFQLGQRGVARTRFEQALVFEPTLSWDPALPPDGIGLLEEARVIRAAQPFLPLRVHPEGTGAYLDGQPLERDRTAQGRHLLQIPGDAEAGRWLGLVRETHVVLPGSLPADTVEWMAEAELRPVLSELLAVSLGPGQPVHVAAAGTVWSGETGGSTWTGRRPARLPRALPPLLVATGGGVALVGGVSAGLALGTGRRAARRADAAGLNEDWQAWVAAEGDHSRARARLLTGELVTAGGAAILGLGVALRPLARVQIIEAADGSPAVALELQR